MGFIEDRVLTDSVPIGIPLFHTLAVTKAMVQNTGIVSRMLSKSSTW